MKKNALYIEHLNVIIIILKIESRSIHQQKTEDLVPVSEFSVNSSWLPLNNQLFTALRSLVLLKTNITSSSSSSDPSQVVEKTEKKEKEQKEPITNIIRSKSNPKQINDSWLRSEVKWRSIGVLEALLSQSGSNLFSESDKNGKSFLK